MGDGEMGLLRSDQMEARDRDGDGGLLLGI